MEEVILMIGANGQIGTELATALRVKFGQNSVITSDIRASKEPAEGEVFEELNVLDKQALTSLIQKYKPTQIYLLAAMLSATGEQYPQSLGFEYEWVVERVGCGYRVWNKENLLA